MNPVNRVGHLLEEPDIKEFFREFEQVQIAAYYMRDPSNVPCPSCGLGTIEVTAFTKTEQTFDGIYEPTSPEGEYAFFVYCHKCHKSIGIPYREESSCSDQHESD